MTASSTQPWSSTAVARAVAFAMSQPKDVDINEILFRPTAQVY
jgi:NADP-dependent 3-hydroxy acid dehydrogenase YdfG